MDSDKIEKLIIKHLAEETNSEEEEMLKASLEASEQNQKLFHFHKSVWKDTSLKLSNTNKEVVYDKIAAQIEPPTIPKHQGKSRWLHFPVFVRAASVILFLAAGLMVWYQVQSNKEDISTLSENNILVKEATNGQKLKAFLPDGSIAWLNAGSKISYRAYFSDSIRLVTLSGMAYFEVEKDSIKPFIVRSGAVDVTALGTAFTVRCYQTEPSIIVALDEGCVLVKIDDGSTTGTQKILKPGLQISYNAQSKKYNTAKVVPDDVFNWRNGVLYFENASFEKVIEELSRWYGVTIEIWNAPEEAWHYTATFRNFNLKEVLQSMSYSKDFTFEIHPEKVIIK